MAASTVSIWNTVDVLPIQVGAGCTVPPATWMTSTPMLSTTSRLTTTAVIQNGITLSQVSVTKPEVSRSLSAIGSRKAPSRVWRPWLRAM